MNYVKLFSYIVDKEIEIRTDYTACSRSYLPKMAGLSLKIQTPEHPMYWNLILYIDPTSFAQDPASFAFVEPDDECKSCDFYLLV